MKNFGYNINVDKNSNVVIGHSEVDHSSVRINSLINIGGDSHFYTVGAIEELNFIIDFIVEGATLIIDGNYENYFLLDDVLTISYKEYELLTILNIKNKGSNYKTGDTLSLDGGIMSKSVFDNTTQPTILKIEEIDSSGGINKLSIINKGSYLNFPEKNNMLKGGSGSGANILIESNLNPNRRMIERQVASSKNSGPNTIIGLGYKLPPEIKEGKLSVNKYKIILTSNYVGETKRNAQYHIIRDYSPLLNLPLVIKGSNKLEESYNFSILKLEKKIKELEDKINNK